jgi:hypothetical protein
MDGSVSSESIISSINLKTRPKRQRPSYWNPSVGLWLR